METAPNNLTCRTLSLPVALGLIVGGCSRAEDVPARPTIGADQIEIDAKAGLPNSAVDQAYEAGEIEVLKTTYSGDQAAVVLRAGSINVGSLAPAEIEGVTSEIRRKVARVDTIPYKLRLEYQWVQGEWRLRRLNNLTFK